MKNTESKESFESALRMLRQQDFQTALSLMVDEFKAYGNWNQNAYTLGLYNGLETALALFQKRDPALKQIPEEGYIDDFVDKDD
jgi:hypothetical protein